MRIRLVARERYRNNRKTTLIVNLPLTSMGKSLVALTGNILTSIYTETLNLQ